MRIKIYGSPRDLSMTDTEVIERQVQFALSRFDGLVQKGVVTVKQSIDSHDCRIQLRLRSGVSITSRECRTDLATATSAAARGVAGALDRHIALLRPIRLAGISTPMKFGD